MNADLLTLIFAPLSIALLIWALQQLKELHRLRSDLDTALRELTQARAEIQQNVREHEEALADAKKKYQEEAKRKDDEIAHLKLGVSSAVFWKEKHDQLLEERISDYPPGANPGL